MSVLVIVHVFSKTSRLQNCAGGRPGIFYETMTPVSFNASERPIISPKITQTNSTSEDTQHASTHVRAFIYTLYAYIYIFIHMYICVSVNIYIYIYIHIHTYTCISTVNQMDLHVPQPDRTISTVLLSEEAVTDSRLDDVNRGEFFWQPP